MIALYRRFTKLGRSDRRLLLEAAILMALVWAGLRLLPFGTVRRTLHRCAPSPTARQTGEADEETVRRVHWAITALAARFPSATCLIQALTADALLRRRSVACELRLGVRAGGGGDVPIEAHAWIECAGKVAIGSIEDLSTFEPLDRPSSIVHRRPSRVERSASPIHTLLRGELKPWAVFGMAPEEFLQACRDGDVTCLIAQRLQSLPSGQCDWPAEVCETLAKVAREQAVKELLRQKELIRVLDALASEEIHPILLKGTALAYSLYDCPSLRPRLDTDFLILQSDVTAVRRAMTGLGYGAPMYCEGDLIFCQFPVKRTDEFGLTHTFDFHWKISTQPVFADLLTFDEIAAVSMDVPTLGANARGAGLMHALLLACIHPVMHHRNAVSLIWIYDVHLLASRLSESEFDDFAALAVSRRVSSICAHQLGAAHTWFETRVPSRVLTKLDAVHGREPSAAYLRQGRRWSDEFVSSIRGLPSWSDRLRLMREVVFPAPAYMLKSYDVPPSSLAAALLPVLYLHRFVSGGWKVIAGQK